MIYFIGAGPGATDLITVRGMRLLQQAELVIYAGSLVNPDLLTYCGAGCAVMDSASMTLEDVIAAMAGRHREDSVIVRLHTGDPSLYGAIREQMDELDKLSIPYEVVPGVSAFSAAAAALQKEYTLPDVSQSLIITRMAGRTPVPEKESIRSLAAHGASMALYLSAGMLKDLCNELIAGGYRPDTMAAVVYKASWPEEKKVVATLATLPEKAQGITKTALVVVGNFLGDAYDRSRLYDPTFTHGFREGRA